MGIRCGGLDGPPYSSEPLEVTVCRELGGWDLGSRAPPSLGSRGHKKETCLPPTHFAVGSSRNRICLQVMGASEHAHTCLYEVVRERVGRGTIMPQGLLCFFSRSILSPRYLRTGPGDRGPGKIQGTAYSPCVCFNLMT